MSDGRDPPHPVASPRHPEPPRRSTTKEIALDAILAKAKKQQARRPLNYTLIGVVVSSLAAGVVTGVKKASNATDDAEKTEKHAQSTEERLDRLEATVRRLKKHHEALKRAVPLPVEEPPEEKDDPP